MASAPKCGCTSFEESSALLQELKTLAVSEELLNVAETLLRYYPCRQENNDYKKFYDILGGIFTESLAVVHKVKVHTVTTGETFGADSTLLNQVNNHKDLQVEITDLQGSSIIIIFCPISSHVGSDVEAAMKKVSGDKPVILVLMHHTKTPDYSTCGEKWCESFQNIVQDVHVLCHRNLNGLLTYDNETVQQMQEILLRYSSISMVTNSWGTQDQGYQTPIEDSLEGPQSSIEASTQSNAVVRIVKVHTVTTGKTFGADNALLKQVSNQKDLQVESTDLQTSNIIILFCPITSRVGSDVKAAMKKVSGDKPVILVLMHHTRKPDYSCGEKWCESFHNIVQDVHVLYHESVKGLLACSRNNEVVQEMQEMLLQYSSSSISMVTNSQGTQSSNINQLPPAQDQISSSSYLSHFKFW